MSEETVVGVAPVHPAVDTTTRKKRVVGTDIEAALRERSQRAREEDLFYTFRGVEYKLITPMPASFLIHSGQIQDGDNVDMREFVSAIKSAFAGEDGNKFVDAILDPHADYPADAEFLSDVLGSIVEAVSGRPPTN